jgi:exopolysaccharide biosynthesis polyprenyl glycosylphosphotransferase
MDSKRLRRLRFDAAVIATDLAAIALALPATYFVRFHSPFPLAPRGEWNVADYWRIYPVALCAWLIALGWVGVYRRTHEVMSARVFQQLLKGSVLAIAFIIALNFFARIAPETAYARILAPMVLVIAVAFLAAGRAAAQALIRYLREQKGMGLRRLAILGTGDLAHSVAGHLRSQPHPQFRLVGYIAAQASLVGERSDGAEIVGSLDALCDALSAHHLDDVILAEPSLSAEQALHVMLDCEKQMVTCRTVPSVFQLRLAEVQHDAVDGIPLYGLKETPLQGTNAVIKRVFDAVVSGGALLVAGWLFPIIALAIKLDSRGPVFYKQKRIGLDGSRFSCYKFRSMVCNAEDETGPVWAQSEDPRRTRVGTFLRRWNLDELPQLFNVVRGDMSLVGPRPERPFFVKQFKEQLPRYMARHQIKSGLTGWAQVHGLRGQSSISDRLEYDLYYLENWSLWLDLKILFMTLRAWRRGAH